MAKLVWDKTGERLFETGVDHGVLYRRNATGAYTKGVAWNGLTSVTEAPSGAEPTKLYADNIPYVTLVSAEEFGGTIEAYMSPKEFDACDGSASPAPGVSVGQQDRATFGLAYRTKIGNDVVGQDFGYKLHLIYGALAAPSEKAYATVNDSPEAVTLSWEFTTTPEAVTGMKPTSTIIIDSTKATPAQMQQLESLLFGTESTEPSLPLPDDVLEIFK